MLWFQRSFNCIEELIGPVDGLDAVRISTGDQKYQWVTCQVPVAGRHAIGREVAPRYPPSLHPVSIAFVGQCLGLTVYGRRRDVLPASDFFFLQNFFLIRSFPRPRISFFFFLLHPLHPLFPFCYHILCASILSSKHRTTSFYLNKYLSLPLPPN